MQDERVAKILKVLKDLSFTQKDLVAFAREKGIALSPMALSRVLRGIKVAKVTLEIVDKAIDAAHAKLLLSTPQGHVHSPEVLAQLDGAGSALKNSFEEKSL